MINQERAAEHMPLTAALHANESGAILIVNALELIWAKAGNHAEVIRSRV